MADFRRGRRMGIMEKINREWAACCVEQGLKQLMREFK
jgi:hypothetical protein